MINNYGQMGVETILKTQYNGISLVIKTVNVTL